jgi:hypothetical protein
MSHRIHKLGGRHRLYILHRYDNFGRTGLLLLAHNKVQNRWP